MNRQIKALGVIVIICYVAVFAKLKTFWDDEQVFYGHVLGFKGLERRVVVLALNETKPRDRSKERLYVGLSRARDQLVVCGDPEFVREVGGPDVAKRLGL